MSETPRERLLGPLLLAGMVAIPGLFCWLLLRKGYSSSLRWAGFTYAGVMAAVGIAGAIGR